uniref:NADH-ubiquinone oxidoreductase chain 2 n=1 Tax=Caenis sp. JYZ-2018 TaxID=2493714 RepID=A0A3S8Q022_9INSE|nr:NADH dehydrogenase subunit 2 [Caenis sp. JYZ-2018]
MTPSHFLFASTLTLGTLITISSSTWLGIWMGLEMNLLSFIPLMAQLGKFSAEAALKYFLTQAFASATLLLGILGTQLITPSNDSLNYLITTLMIFSLLVKMGAAPTHFWFPEVSNGLSWSSNMILMTWQKIAPFIALLYLGTPFIYMVLVVSTSAIVGGLGGFNQTSMRKILAFSSINHMAWMLMGIYASQQIWSTYFITYSVMTIVMMLYFNMHNINFIHQLQYTNSVSPTETFAVSMNMLSMGGLPPFLGFYPKWLVMEYMMSASLYIMATFMITMTLIVLYFYMRITYASFMMFSKTLKPYMSNLKLTPSLLMWTPLLGLGPAPLLMMM